MKQRLLSVLLVLSFVLSFSVSVFAVELPADGADLSGSIVIIHTNDSHGRMVLDEGGQAGFAAVSGIKKAYEEAGATVLLLDAGDTLHGLPIATINKGADVVSILNAAGYDAMVPGNHDFNYGTDRLLELSKLMKFPLLSANTINKTTGTALFETSTIITKGDVTFGIFGLSTPETMYKTNPQNVQSVTFESPVTHAQEQVKKLQEAEVDCIIALGHIGVDAASEFTSDKIAAEVPGIDIFIDGHSHTAMQNGKPVDPSIALVPHGDTLIASTGEYIQNIGVIIISDDGAIETGLIPYSENLPSDEAIVSALASITTAQDVVLAQVVGNTGVVLNGEREVNRKEESNLGNLAADAFLLGTDADVAFTNGGGIRASIEAGDITKKDLVTVFPFGNYVVTKEVTGAAIIAAMEHGVKDYPELSGGFPQVAGITFKFDETKPAGSRVFDVLIGGAAIDENATYLLATNDFIAAGGDGYTMFESFAIANEFGAMEEILTSYIQANPNKTAEVEGRITVAVNDQTEVPVMDDIDLPASSDINAAEPDSSADIPPVISESPVPEIVETPNAEELVPATQASTAAGVYVVVAGDNLWKIAKDLTDNGDNWVKIYENNKDIIKNPQMIQIGQELAIPEM